METQMHILEDVVWTTPTGTLALVLQNLSRTSRRFRSLILNSGTLWLRLGTNFTMETLRRAIRLVSSQQPDPRWDLTFWADDHSKPQWNFIAGLIHKCSTFTIASVPILRGMPTSINDLSLLPHPPSPLTTLILTGFRVSVAHLLATLSSNHPRLESLQLVLKRTTSLPKVFDLPNLTVLHVAGYPQDILVFGEHLTVPRLKNLILEPRGHPNHLNQGPSPHQNHLTNIPHITIKGNMSWLTVNNYLRHCKSLVSMKLVFMQDQDAHAILSDLTLRNRRPDLPQNLRHISVSPLERIESVKYLLHLVKKANPALKTLTLGLDAAESFSDPV